MIPAHDPFATRSRWAPTLLAALLLALAGCGSGSRAGSAAVDDSPGAALAFTMTGIDGKPYDLRQHLGAVVLLVNVASRCHYTPQYEALEALYQRCRERGLVIIGVPANDFFGQEPGSNGEIQQFCTATYHVTFPMLAKVSVKGDDICPLYRYLTTASPKPGAISWNFNKFLVGRDGRVVERFGTRTRPDDPALVSAVERALDAKP